MFVNMAYATQKQNVVVRLSLNDQFRQIPFVKTFVATSHSLIRFQLIFVEDSS